MAALPLPAGEPEEHSTLVAAGRAGGGTGRWPSGAGALLKRSDTAHWTSARTCDSQERLLCDIRGAISSRVSEASGRDLAVVVTIATSTPAGGCSGFRYIGFHDMRQAYVSVRLYLKPQSPPMPLSFDKKFDPAYGVAVAVAPGIRRRLHSRPKAGLESAR